MKLPASMREASSYAAMFLLVLVLFPPASLGQEVKFDASTPIEQLKSSAAKGNADAMLELGERLVQGTGVTKDGPEGLKWLQKAADAGKREAWYDMGMVYSNALGVEMDMKKAMTFYRKGAELGEANCQTSLGLFYQAGEKIPGGVKADPAEARKWYRMAAEQNHPEAILHLGQLLIWGEGGDTNAVEGAKWFRRGAELGNPEAQWSLGQCYLQGKGVPKDSVQAYALFAAAADGADRPDMKKGMGEQRDKLGKTLSPAQLTEAQGLTEKWKARRGQ
jgi:uncharacterized protein